MFPTSWSLSGAPEKNEAAEMRQEGSRDWSVTDQCIDERTVCSGREMVEFQGL